MCVLELRCIYMSLRSTIAAGTVRDGRRQTTSHHTISHCSGCNHVSHIRDGAHVKCMTTFEQEESVISYISSP